MYPIVVTVYDRVDFLVQCIQSLQANEEARDSVLYISSDAACKEEDIDKIAAVREYINTISGFKEVIPVFHETNQGGFLSSLKTIDLAIKDAAAFIFLEDDIVVSDCFLKYMNDCLNAYMDNESVFFICSYIWPGFKLDHLCNDDIFLWRGYCPWGMGSWRSKWEQINFDLSDFSSFFSHEKLVADFNKIDPNTIRILKSDLEGKLIAMDARISLNIFLNNKLSVFPLRTMCVNRGHDGRGANGSTKSIYMNQELSKFDPIIKPGVGLSEEVQMYIYKSKYSWFKNILYYPMLRFETFVRLRHMMRKVFG